MEPDVIEAWLAGKLPSTRAGYLKDLKHFVAWLTADLQGVGLDGGTGVDYFLGLGAGAANHVVLAYREVGNGACGSATVNRRLAAVKSLVKAARRLGRLTWAVEVEGLRHEPRRDMSGPDGPERKRVARALGKLGDTPRAKRDRAVVGLLYAMGLRRGEVVALDLADVDLAGMTLAVRGKGHREKEKRPVPPNVGRALAEWVCARGAGGEALFVRTDRPGRFLRLSGGGVGELVGRLGASAGLARALRPHGFRHAAITVLRESGETDRDTMAFSRHEKTETLRRYDDTKGKAAARLSRRLDKGMG